MFSEKMINQWLSDAADFCQSFINSPSNWIQIVVVIISFILGWGVRLKLQQPLIDKIDRSGLHFRIRQGLKNLTKLILPAVAVFFMGIFVQLSSLDVIKINMSITSGLVSLFLAWIVIRVAAQVIENSFTRSIVATIAWVIAALNLVGVMDDAIIALEGLGFSIGDSRITALAVIKAILLIFALTYAALFFSTLMDRKLTRVSSLTPASRVLISKIGKVLLVTFALLVGVTTAGVDLSVLAVFSGAVGLGIGFGLQKVVSNLFSGILLLMDRSINPGDIIEIQNANNGTGTFGWVHHMGARYTEIVTRDNKSFLIPNEDFITQQVINWSHGDTLVRLEIEFGVHYDSDPNEVIEIAKEAAKIPERVSDKQAPVCWIKGFGDSSIDFTLRFWISDAEKGVANIKGPVFLALWNAFKKHNIQIPYPHREVFVHDMQKKPA